MNKLIVVFSLFVFLNSCGAQNQYRKCLKVNIDVIGKINPSFVNEKEGEFYSVKISLVNKTDSTLRFWVMSCSWQDNWVFNSNDIIFYRDNCLKNIMKVKELAPNGILTYTGVLAVRTNQISKRLKNLRLGFIFVRENEFSYLSKMDYHKILLEQKDENRDVFWSEKPIFF